jgi:hypothetical protein
MYGPSSAPDRTRIYKTGSWSDEITNFGSYNEDYEGSSASVFLGQDKEPIWMPPGCDEDGVQLAFADGCVGKPRVVDRTELLHSLHLVEVVSRQYFDWPHDPPARAA